MRHWKGQAAVKFMKQFKHTPSWCKQQYRSGTKIVPTLTLNQVVVIVVHNEFQSQPCLIICYINDETLKGSSCCQLPESIQTHWILVQKVGLGIWVKPNLSPSTMTLNQVAVTSVYTKFKSQACGTIDHTYNETLEGSSCC